MTDMAKGMRSFRKGLNDDDDDEKSEKTDDKKTRQLNDDKMVNVTPEKDKSKTSS